MTTSALRHTPATSSDHFAPAAIKRWALALFKSVTATE
jgi:hypothetical protein